MQREFHKLKLEHIRTFKETKTVAAFGFRSCIFMNEDLSVLSKFLDANRNEKYYCGEFYKNNSPNFCSKNKYFFIVGGESGVIKILDLEEGSIAGFLQGHTGAVCDIKVFDHYLASSGEDSSIRIWNLITLECITVFGGMFGHKDHVLSIDILYNKRMIVSSGTDCAIKQWEIPTSNQFNNQSETTLNSQSKITTSSQFNNQSETAQFKYEPFTSFNNIHRCPIVKVKYYGDMIISLSNNVISIIFNNRRPIDQSFGLKQDDPIFVGNIDVFNNCKTFDVIGHVFIGMSTVGDVYLFDLRNILDEKSPFLTWTGVNEVEDFSVMNDYLYISSGNTIHCKKIDFTYVDEARLIT